MQACRQRERKALFPTLMYATYVRTCSHRVGKCLHWSALLALGNTGLELEWHWGAYWPFSAIWGAYLSRQQALRSCNQ